MERLKGKKAHFLMRFFSRRVIKPNSYKKNTQKNQDLPIKLHRLEYLHPRVEKDCDAF